MTTLLRCVNGHEWRADPGSSAPCPMCGAPERTMATPPTFPEERPALSIGSEMPQTPPVLAGYEVLEEIGRGGMGIVYRARHRDSGQVVALKVIRKEKLSSADMVSRFRREALASSRLQHPNLVQVFEADLAGETPFLAIEFVPGLTLQKLVEDGGPLPVALACDFIRQAALGLEHADRMRLVHRDIKPSNIMVLAPVGLPLPPRPVVKILDMGVARLFQSEHDAPLTTLTRDGSVIGTPDYIAPEQLENPRGVDIRADIYSLGCTLYYLLTGQVPFPGGSLVQKLDRQRWHVAPAVGQLRPDIPSAVAAVVRKLMAKHPDDRFQERRRVGLGPGGAGADGCPAGHRRAGLAVGGEGANGAQGGRAGAGLGGSAAGVGGQRPEHPRVGRLDGAGGAPLRRGQVGGISPGRPAGPGPGLPRRDDARLRSRHGQGDAAPGGTHRRPALRGGERRWQARGHGRRRPHGAGMGSGTRHAAVAQRPAWRERGGCGVLARWPKHRLGGPRRHRAGVGRQHRQGDQEHRRAEGADNVHRLGGGRERDLHGALRHDVAVVGRPWAGSRGASAGTSRW